MWSILEHGKLLNCSLVGTWLYRLVRLVLTFKPPILCFAGNLKQPCYVSITIKETLLITFLLDGTFFWLLKYCIFWNGVITGSWHWQPTKVRNKN